MANPWGKKQAAHSWDHGDKGDGHPSLNPVTNRVFFGDISAETRVQEFRRMVVEEAGAIATLKQNPAGESWGLIICQSCFAHGADVWFIDV